MFVPYRDDSPRYRMQYVTFGLIAVNVLVFILGWSIRDNPEEMLKYDLKYGSTSHRLNELLNADDFKDMGLENYRPGFNPIRSITSGFLHADIMHLLGNMWFLFLFGGAVEGKLGHLRMGLTYLVSLIFADAAQHLLDPKFLICIGASGAVGGMVGTYWFLFCRAQIEFFYWIFISFYGSVALTVHWAVAWLFGWDLIMWLLSSRVQSKIAHSAHLGGLVCGLLCGLALRQFSHMTLDGEDMLTRFVIWRARKKRGAAYFDPARPRKQVSTIDEVPQVAPNADLPAPNRPGLPPANPAPEAPPKPKEEGPKTLDFE